jgi:hypothetical protein
MLCVMINESAAVQITQQTYPVCFYYYFTGDIKKVGRCTLYG